MNYSIMVAVDGEPEHRAALDWAAARAARDGARLELVHVIDRSWNESGEQPGRLLELAAKSLLAAEVRIAAHHARTVADRAASAAGRSGVQTVVPDIDIGTRVLFGHVGHELASASDDADLLVMGTPSQAERGHAFASSIAVRVAAVAECTVVAVPHDWEGEGRGVVVGADGERTTEAAVAFAADEAALLGEPLTVVCAGYLANPLLAGFVPEMSLGDRRERVAEDAAQAARALHPELTVSADTVETSPARGIVAEADGSRLLVIGTHDRRGVQRMMLGSVGHDVLLNALTPVAVVRNRVPVAARPAER
ncbi:universal stress protein [Leifsonia sp. NPDC077715]|uniref:universal stress protein n=1 Tax=Leifsonia sp. NPDC077715 TaxID=3155539 RepID=UPI0034285745